ncbi:MAG: hypothetical protein ACJA0G_000959 [Kangiellaceae bacterium]|jgi:hypothetical protein
MKLDDDIHNYYEHLVLEHIVELGLTQSKSDNYLADLSCLALNQLTPRYIRYEVDMAFYLPNSERQQMRMNVINATQTAASFLDEQPIKA